MKLVGYIFFYIIFIILESLSSLTSIFPIKFDLLIPSVVFSVSSGGVISLFFTVIFGLITGLSQGFVWININLALLVYLLVSTLKNTFHIYSKQFIFILTTSILSIKFMLLFSSNFKGLIIDKNIVFYFVNYVLLNGVLSFYIISFANYLNFLLRKKYEKNTYNT